MPRAFFVLRERDFLDNMRGKLVIKSLPDGVEFIFAEYSAVRRGWLCIVEHESFEETADGGQLPFLNVEFATAVIGRFVSTSTYEPVEPFTEPFTIAEMERRLSAIAAAKDMGELEQAFGGPAELSKIVANAEAHKGIMSAEMAMRARRLIEVKPGQIVAGGIAMGGVCRSSPDSFVFTERKPTLAEFEAATDNLTCGESLGEPVNRKTWRDREPLL